LTSVVDCAIAFALLIVLMLINGMQFHASIVLAIPIAGVAALCAAAFGMWLSALNLQFRDVRHALPFIIQILVYATPVFYPATMIPERVRFLLAFNPMAAVVEGFRAALFGTPIPFLPLALATVTALVMGFAGFVRFCRLERTFADRI
jgi:lipopolysaccharide transport system permease protein